jgi:carbon monoxide dehydrogenase subunit G
MLRERMTRSVIQIDAPRTQVFAVLRDFGRYRAWLPGCDESRVVSTQANTDEVEIALSAPRRMTLRLRFESVPAHSLGFTMTKGDGLKAYRGSYRLIDAADGRGTVVMADLEIDAGAFAPAFLVNKLAAKALADTGAAMRRYLKSLPPTPAGGPSAPAGRTGKARRILRVIRTQDGYRAWFRGVLLRPDTRT